MTPILFVSGHLYGAARGSEVEVAACYWLQGSVFEPRWKKNFFFFFTPIQSGLRNHPDSSTINIGFLSRS